MNIENEVTKSIISTLEKIKKLEFSSTEEDGIIFFFYNDPSEEYDLKVLSKLGAVFLLENDRAAFGQALQIIQPRLDEILELLTTKQGYVNINNGQLILKRESKNEPQAILEKTTNNKKVLVVGELTLDLEKTFLQYKKSKSLEIEPDSKPIRLLVMFMNNPDKLLEYIEIAKQLELNCYHEGLTNKDVASEVSHVRRDLATILEKAGMTKEEINVLIVAKKNVGYKLVTIIPRAKSYSTETQ